MKFPALFQRLVSQRLAFSFYRLFLVSLLLTTYYLLLTTSPVSAQSNPYLNPNTNPDVPKNLHTWTQNVMIEVMSAMSCQLAGIDPTDPKGKCLGVDQKTGNIGYAEGGGGAIGVAGKMIGMLYTPPLHTGDYFKYLASNFGIAKQAHAASGFEGLKPVQNLWVAFRNIVYLLFVIVFIVIGLAIMLRVRIDPRTVMTIQNQIPKIIIGILLVTFSFAIAGFLIDLMYVVIFLSYELISGAVPTTVFDNLNPLNLQNSTVFTAADGVRGGGIFGIANAAFLPIVNIVKNLFTNAVGTFISMLVPDAIENLGSFFKNVIGGIILGLLGPLGILGSIIARFFGIVGGGDALGYAVGGLVGIIAYLIIAIALLIALIRLWFSLIMAYIGILLGVVFAPFWIAGALLPGSPIGFGAWLRNMIANLAAFPAVIIMFLLARAFIDGFGDTPSDTAFVPPLIGNFAGKEPHFLGPLIALGIILMTPNVVAMVKAALKAPSVPTVGIFGAIGGGAGAINLPAHAAKFGAVAYGLSHVSRVYPGAGKLPIVGRLLGGTGRDSTPT